MIMLYRWHFLDRMINCLVAQPLEVTHEVPHILHVFGICALWPVH